MADQTAKGEELERKAEKTLGGWGIFCNKYDEAADLFDSAAICFKLAKNCILLPLSLSSLSFSAAIALRNCSSCNAFKLTCLDTGIAGERAGSVSIKLADCHLKVSLSFLFSADATQSLNQAVKLFLEIGRLNMAARYYKNLVDSMDEGDVAKFTDAAQEYDSMTRL
ncbi:hypothetical protein BHE74_00030346, partial [Ensete ventricosum]